MSVAVSDVSLFDANTFGANRMLRLTHGTNNANVRHILPERGAGSGLRLPRSYTDGWMFGPGIYFANVASKPAQYCRGSSKHPRMMFLADVAVGEMYLAPTDMGNTREAPKRHHSVWGKPFTAYDVTMILRALFPYPQRELPHYDQHGVPGVQPEIHRQMVDYLAAGAYTVDGAYPNGVDPAHLYTPNRRGRRAGRWFSLSAVFGAGHGSAPLPVGAWVIKDSR